MVERFEAKGIDVTAEREELSALRRRQTASVEPRPDGTEAAEAAYLEVRQFKRRLFLRDPELAPLRRVLFVARRHPYEPSHNYSDILDARWRPGGGIRLLDIPQIDGRLEPVCRKGNVVVRCPAGCDP